MKNIANFTPALAVAIAVAGSAFAPSAKATSASGYDYQQQDYPYQATSVSSVQYWTDVTSAVDDDPLGYTDNQNNCHWSSTVVCVAAFYNGSPVDVYDGISQLF